MTKAYYVPTVFVYWAHRSGWKFEAIPSVARMENKRTRPQSMLLAFETRLIPKSPSTVWNLISVHPPPRPVECRGPAEHTKWDPHSVGGICALSAEMGLSSVLSLSLTQKWGYVFLESNNTVVHSLQLSSLYADIPWYISKCGRQKTKGRMHFSSMLIDGLWSETDHWFCRLKIKL